MKSIHVGPGLDQSDLRPGAVLAVTQLMVQAGVKHESGNLKSVFTRMGGSALAQASQQSSLSHP